MAIAEAVKKATIETQEMYQEQWVTGDELCKSISFFTKEWLKRYGEGLPRERVGVQDENGVNHKTSWCYPKMRILRMIGEGSLRQINLNVQPK